MPEIESKKELDLLVKLQLIDSEVHNLEKNIALLPEEMNAWLAEFNEKENAVAVLKKEIEDCQKQCREKEREVNSGKDSLGKLNSKLNDVKTNKEYSAVLTEIDTTKHTITQLEDDELSLMEKQESLSASLKEKEHLLIEEKKVLEEKKKENQDDIEQMKKNLQNGLEKRNNLVTRLDKNIYKNYSKISKLRDGRAVVTYRNDACSGCYKSIIPQLVVNLKKNDSIVTCPHCNRFLYWKE